MREDIERQHVDFGVPEDVTLVGRAGKGTSADGHPPIVRIGGTDQVITGETQRLLERIVALDLDISGAPTRFPC